MCPSVRLSVTLSVSSPLSRFHGARFWPIFAALLATNRRIPWDECSTSGCIWGCRSVRRGAESRAIPLGLSVRVVPHEGMPAAAHPLSRCARTEALGCGIAIR